MMERGYYLVLDKKTPASENPHWGKPEIAEFTGVFFVFGNGGVQRRGRTLIAGEDLTVLCGPIVSVMDANSHIRVEDARRLA